jgi:hypothetical protein
MSSIHPARLAEVPSLSDHEVAALPDAPQHQQQRLAPLTTIGLATPEALTARTPYVEQPGERGVSIQSADRKGSGVRRDSGTPSRSRNTS